MIEDQARHEIFLRQACFAGHLSAAQQRVSEGANPSAPDVNGLTALLLALKNGHAHVARWLLSLGANVNAHTTMGESVLHAATKLGDPELLQSILDAGADVHMKAGDQWSALHTAASAKSEKCIPVLLRAGLSLDAKDESGMRPIHVAAISAGDGAEIFIAPALSHGASVDARDKSGRTALHHACLRNSKAACEVLVSYGADINALDSAGKRPMDLTTTWGIQLFLKARGGYSSRASAPPTMDERMTAAAMSGQADILLDMMQADDQDSRMVKAQTMIDLAKPLGHYNVVAAMQALQAQHQIAAIRMNGAAPGLTSS